MKALVIEGGALRTVFTAGVLDAFLANGFDPFDIYLGVSGGSMSLSYFYTQQYRATFDILQNIASDSQFMGLKNLWYNDGYINLSYLLDFSEKRYPFPIDHALEKVKQHQLEIVATNLHDGAPVYLRPNKKNWLTCLKASSTLPFLTKGYCWVDDLKLMDGGWSDPIPAKRAFKLGAEKVVVVRTQPLHYKSDWRYLGMLGKFLHRNNPQLSEKFAEEHLIYNRCLHFLNGKHHSRIIQIAPPDYLKTTAYSASADTLNFDYRTGLDMALQFLHKYGDQW
ncbi:MAG: patatin family protein [Bacteroidota bacterium]